MISRGQKNLQKILKGGYGVNSGVYSAIDPGVKMTLGLYGQYEPTFSGAETDDTYNRLLQVDSMSDDSINEDEVGQNLFGHTKGVKHDSILGYYIDTYIGYVKEGTFRKNGSSGGLTSWILVELYRQGKIDGVIHVHSIDPKKSNGKLFKYVISETTEGIVSGAKSRYYPMELSEVLAAVKNKPGKYAVVGIPEFIMELRLLARIDPIVNKRIKYTIGLVCGHQKSTKYAEALAWQQGVKPGDLSSIDFRVKQAQGTAIDYLHQINGLIDNKKVLLKKTHAELFVDNWAAGFFKSKFSDFTDNVFNEVADITLGDAWLPQYNGDSKGNNIVIVRNPEIASIIQNARKQGLVKLDRVDEQEIKESQLGLIHHSRDELPYRLYRQKIRGLWTPTKRVSPSRKLPYLRKKVQNTRYQMALNSHKTYKKAVVAGDWMYFEVRMTRLLIRYSRLYKILGWLSGDTPSVALRKRLKLRTHIKSTLHRAKHATRVRTRVRSVLHIIKERRKQSMMRSADGAIVTLSGYFNYGNVLQRFALQEFLHKNSYNFVSYFKGAEGTDDVSFGSARDAIKQFVHTYITTKEPSEKDNYNVYITGSDQVWRNWDYADERSELGYYYLDFVTNPAAKRIAYAASFGVDTIEGARISKDFIRYIKPVISKFSAIAMRENSGVELVKKTWKVQSRQVVDPTMLLTADDYSQLIDASPYTLDKTNSVFAYILGINESKDAIVNKVNSEMNSGVDRFYPRLMTTLPPVEQWLKGFRDAELVVTDSFHGMVLAIINNTPFVVVENADGGVTRMTSLLEKFGLQDRLIAENSANDFTFDLLEQIDWDDVNKRLQTYREDSGEWLLDSIKN